MRLRVDTGLKSLFPWPKIDGQEGSGAAASTSVVELKIYELLGGMVDDDSPDERRDDDPNPSLPVLEDEMSGFTSSKMMPTTFDRVTDSIPEQFDLMEAAMDDDETSSHAHSIPNEHNSMRERKPSRLHHYKRMQLTFKRMLKSDIRRTFPFMYCNVLNSGRCKSVERLLNRCMPPTAEVICQPLAQLLSPELCYTGPREHINHLLSIESILPDYAIIPLGIRVIRQLHDDICISELYATVKGTRLDLSDGHEVGGSDRLLSTDIDFKIKISFYIDREGNVVKLTGSIPSFLPTFAS
eukprot:scaffold2507_cov257-Ochromonas_danica.AAC.4